MHRKLIHLNVLRLLVPVVSKSEASVIIRCKTKSIVTSKQHASNRVSDLYHNYSDRFTVSLNENKKSLRSLIFNHEDKKIVIALWGIIICCRRGGPNGVWPELNLLIAAKKYLAFLLKTVLEQLHGVASEISA